MTLLSILLATLAGGVVSVLAAAVLSLTVLRRMAHRLIGFSVGVMLAAAFLDILPEALSQLDAHTVGFTLLCGMLGFFVLEKLALWRHDHRHGACHDAPAPVGSLIVLGDGLHNFVDGILIAASFLQDPALGVATALAVIAHEIPQEVGDFMVLLQAGYSRQQALLMNLMSSLAAVLGGVCGYFALQDANHVVPYVLALAAASFIYIAVADLVPNLHAVRRPLESMQQLLLLVLGVSVVCVAHG